jgi:hypothetical protein
MSLETPMVAMVRFQNFKRDLYHGKPKNMNLNLVVSERVLLAFSKL